MKLDLGEERRPFLPLHGSTLWQRAKGKEVAPDHIFVKMKTLT